MKKRLVLHFSTAVLLGACLACGKSSTSPSSDAVADFITGIVASDGSVASRQGGAPPTPNGGPTLQVSSAGSVSAGGTDIASLRASAPIQTVYVSVNNSTGFYQIQLQSSTTTVTLTDQLASQLPAGSYTASYRAAAPGTGGLVGDPATVTNTVVSTGGGGGGGSSVNVAGTWGAAGQAVFVLTQSGNTVSGTEVFTGITSTPGVTITGTVSGTVSGNTVTGTNVVTDSVTSAGITVSCSSTSTFTATISGNTMTGNYSSGSVTCVGTGVPIPQVSTFPGGPFVLTKQ